MYIEERWAKENEYFDRGKMKVEKLVLHSPGTAQPSADVFYNNYNRTGANALPHAFLERSGRVLQLMPWDNVGCHVGAGPKGGWNGLSIGVEVCEPAGHTYQPNSGTMIGYDAQKNAAYFADIYEQAIQLFAYLCERYGLTERDIYCHAEVHRLGYGSNHIDIEHWWPKHGKNMDTFRADVGARLRGETVRPAEPETEYTSGMYKVLADNLTIRRGPGTDYEAVGYITDHGCYTATEIVNGHWGRLKSGAGYISVHKAYCRRVGDTDHKLPYMVKVLDGALNIRSGPGTDYPVMGVIRDQGSYTVTETSEGTGADLWGKLKSGAGWIALGGAFTSRPE